MRAEVETRALVAALARLRAVWGVARKGEALGRVRLEVAKPHLPGGGALWCSCAEADTLVTVRVRVAATACTPGGAVVSAPEMARLLAGHPDRRVQVAAREGAGWLSVEGEQGRAEVSRFAPGTWPPPGGGAFDDVLGRATVEPAEFAAAARRVLRFAAEPDEPRATLASVLLECSLQSGQLTLTATDTLQLHRESVGTRTLYCKGGARWACCVPAAWLARVLAAMGRPAPPGEPLWLYLSAGQLSFEGHTFAATVGPLDEQAPKYFPDPTAPLALLGTQPGLVTFARGELAAAVRWALGAGQAKVVLADTARGTVLWAGRPLDTEGSAGGPASQPPPAERRAFVEVALPSATPSKGLRLHLDAAALLGALHVAHGDRVSLEWGAPEWGEGAGVVRVHPMAGSGLHLLMAQRRS